MRFQLTVRYGDKHQRYHTFAVEADDAAEGLRLAADRIPEEVVAHADLVEMRVSVDPDDRSYLGEDPPDS